MSSVTQKEIDKQILYIRKLKTRLDEHWQERFKFESIKVNTRKCLALMHTEQCKNHRFEFEEFCFFHYTQFPKPKLLGQLDFDDNVQLDDELIDNVNAQIKQAIENETPPQNIPIVAAQAKLTELMSRRSAELTLCKFANSQFTSKIECLYNKKRIIFNPKRCSAWLGDSQCKQKLADNSTFCNDHTEDITICTTEVIATYNRHLKTKLKEKALRTENQQIPANNDA